MARLLQDGAEMGDLSALHSTTVSGTGAAVTADSSIKRSGAYSYKCDAGTVGTSSAVVQASSSVTAALGSFFGSAWLYFPTGGRPPTEATVLMLVGGTSTVRLQLRVNSSGDATLYSQDNVQIGTPMSGVITEGTWHHVELVVDNTTGAVNAVVNAYINGVSYGSANVQTGEIQSISAGPYSTAQGGVCYVDDIILNNATGSVNVGRVDNDKLVFLPVDANGDTNGTQGTDWDTAPSSGGTMYQMVDDAPPGDDASSYIIMILASSGPTNRFHDFGLVSSASVGIGSGDAVSAVGVMTRVAGASGTSATYQRRIKSQASGTVLESSGLAIATTSWNTNDDAATTVGKCFAPISQSDPQAGGAWTPALLDAAQIGVRASDANPDVYISALYLNVSYIPATAGQPAVRRSGAKSYGVSGVRVY